MPHRFHSNHRLFWAFLLTVFLCCLLVGCHRNPAKVAAEAMANAERYMQQGRVESAIIEYRNALKANPNSEEAHLKLGQAYMKVAQVQQGYEQFKQVLVISPNNRDAQLALGFIYLKTGMLDDAEQMSQTLLAHDPKNVEARLLLANTTAAKGMMPRAILQLEALAKEQPALAAVHMNLGIFYAGVGKKDSAESELRTALSLAPASFEVRKALAAVYLSTGRPGEAEQLYRAAVKDAPSSVEAQLTLAQFLILQNRSAEAEQVYKDLVQAQNNSAQSRFNLASFYVRQQRFAEARKLDEQIVQNAADFYQARLQLAELAMNEGDLKQADKVMSELPQDRKQNADVQVVQARVFLAEHKPQPAIDLLDPLLRHENAAATHYFLGVAYGQMGNLQRAESEMQAAISVNPRFLDAYIELAQMMLNRGQAKASLQYSRLAWQQSPDPRLLLLIGGAYASLGDSANAEKSFEAAAKAMPQSPEPLNRLGLLRAHQKRNADAIACFEKALQLDPHDYQALEGIVDALIQDGQNKKAVERMHAELAREESPELLNMAGKVAMESGDFNSAEGYLRKVLERSPDNFTSYMLLGSLYTEKKQTPQAIQYYESALKMRKNDAGLLTMLGTLYQGNGDVKKALDCYKQALDIEPNSGVVANNMAWLYVDNLGDMDKALELAQRAKSALPKAASVNDTLGWIYVRRHLNGMAIPLLTEAVRSDPKSADFHFHLAVALQHNGRKSEARQELATALKLNAGLRQRGETQEILQAR